MLAVAAEAADRHVIEVVLLCRAHAVWTAPSIPHANALLLDFPEPIAVALLDLHANDGDNGRTFGADLRRRFPDIRLVFLLDSWQDVTSVSTSAVNRVLVRPLAADAVVAAVES